MEIQILSDLHLESPKAYDIFEIPPKAQYLALLGDIGYVTAHKDDFSAFLRRQLKQFKAVLFVPGNHEAYRSTWDDTIETLRALEQEARGDVSLGEFVLMDRTIYRPADTNVVLMGCSLFSSIPPEKQMAIEMGINDFYQTRDWTTNSHNDSHRRDVTWLNTEVSKLEKSDVKIMILSHWSPSQDPRTMDARHSGSSITCGFSTDMSEEPCFRSDKVKVWAFGHTHYNCDVEFERGGDLTPIRLVTNQRGYYFAQAEKFDLEKTITL